MPDLSAREAALQAKQYRAMRRFRTFLLVVMTFLVLFLAVAAGLAIARRPLSPHQVRGGQDTIRVLFIGNSYTFVNNLPGLLIELSAHESKPLDAEMIAEGGATLANQWNEGKALAAIQRGGWDYVVLQEQSTLGSGAVVNGIDQIGDPATFHDYVRLFNTEIQKVGAKTLLYLTWARQNAPQNQALLTNAYMGIADELHTMVAPVGIAWQNALKANPRLILHQDDGSHPDTAGSYLAACVFYATIYNKSPEGLPAHVSSTLVDSFGVLQQGDVNLSLSDALFLQQIAWQTISAR